MKKIIYYFLVLILALYTVSCSKDLGDYNYKEINEIEITDMESSYEAFTGQELFISPTFEYSAGTLDEKEDLEYEWYVWIRPDRKVLSTERDLKIDLPLLPGSYDCHYTVLNKKTGVFSRKKFVLNVTSEISTGWLVLNDINGTGRLDLMNYKGGEEEEFQRYTDILSVTNSVPELKGTPKIVKYINKRDPFTSANVQGIILGTDQETYLINNNNYGWDKYKNISIEIMRPTDIDFNIEKSYPMGISLTGSPQQENYLLGSDGAVSYENTIQSAMHGPAINRLSGGMIPVSEYMATLDGSVFSYLIMYDTKDQRFLVHAKMNKTAYVPSAAPQMFDPADMGMELLYLSHTRAVSGQFYALFKDSNGKVHLARFTAGPDDSVFVPLAFEEVKQAPLLAQADFYSIDPTNGYLMYSVDSKVYQYDPFNRTNKQMLDFGSRKISLMKYERMVQNLSNARYLRYSSQLMVCTYDENNPETSGKMELYTVPNLNGDLELADSFDGFGKIVDVTYRE